MKIKTLIIYCASILIIGGFSVRQASAAEVDTDQDGLSDRLEKIFGTDPAVADTDADGFVDGVEVMNGYSPTTTGDVHLQKSIFINLKVQRLEQRVMNVPLTSFVISSGMRGMATPIGNFTLLKKAPRAWSRAAKLWMPYWMLFSWRGQALHELPEWPNGKKEGADHLGKPVSHGCVRLGIGPAKMLYDWAPVGTPIKIVSK